MNEALSLAVATLARGEAAQRLELYVRLLLERNTGLNLTGARDVPSALEQIRDSLTLVPYVREPLIDIGSGGGFPAIPLAIVTGMRVTLVESVLKKARFLEEMARVLELPLDVRSLRAEEAARDPALRAAFHSATARAVAGLTTVLELAVPFLTIGGLAVLQRGGLGVAEKAAAVDAALVLGAEVEAEIAAGTGDGGRSLLLVRKTASTGPRFPRRTGIPAKRPLCWEGRDA